MGIKIWLDDDRDPRKEIIQKNFGATSDMLWCRTVGEAWSLIMEGNVEFISFDHDLGTTKKGYNLACLIEKHANMNRLKRIKWAVHSKNSVGSKGIVMAMEAADRFWSFHEQNAS